MRGRNSDINRRTFVQSAALPALCAAGGYRHAQAAGSLSRREAQFYEKLPNKKIRCKLCPRECVIDDRERGYCGVRENQGGTYYTLVHPAPAQFTLTRSKRSRCSTSIPALSPFRWPRPAATSIANSARTGKSRKSAPSKCEARK